MFLTLDEFLNQDDVSAWILHPEFHTFHVKKSTKIIKEKELTCIEISVITARKKGQGSFTKLRERLQNYNLYFCNVVNKRFGRHLLEIGGIRVMEDTGFHSVFLEKKYE